MLKNLVFLTVTLASAATSALQVEWDRDSAYGQEQILINYKPALTKLYTNTTTFEDERSRPLRLGFFERKGRGSFYTKLQDLASPESADQFAARQSNIAADPHLARIFLNGKEAAFTSPAYETLVTIIQNEFTDKAWTLVQGMEARRAGVGPTLVLQSYKEGKKSASRTRAPASICKAQGQAFVCPTKDGVIYLHDRTGK